MSGRDWRQFGRGMLLPIVFGVGMIWGAVAEKRHEAAQAHPVPAIVVTSTSTPDPEPMIDPINRTEAKHGRDL